MNLSEQSLEEAIISMRDAISNGSIRAKPTRLWVYPQYKRDALRILGWLKQPVKRVQGLRKRKRALYWREKV